MSKNTSLFLLGLALALSVDAKSWRTERYAYDAQGISLVEIEHAVGSLEIVPADGTRVEVLMRVECSGRRNRCEERAGKISVEGRQSGTTLELRIEGFPKTVNSFSVDLEIALPRSLSLEVERGVGETRITDIEGDISVETGVGEVRIHAPARAVGEIRSECGVGEVDLDVPGGRFERDGFLFLGNQIDWRGAGRSTIEVEVGVGSVEIELE